MKGKELYINNGRDEKFKSRMRSVWNELVDNKEEVLKRYGVEDKFYIDRANEALEILKVRGGRFEQVASFRLAGNVELDLEADTNAFNYGYDHEKGAVIGRILISDPEMIAAQEEILHAFSCYGRGAVLWSASYGLEMSHESNLVRVLEVVDHLSIMVDIALTLAALEMGDKHYLFFKDMARENNKYENTRKLGMWKTPLNARFQFPLVNEKLLELYLEANSCDLEYMYEHLPQLVEPFELMALAYGDNFLSMCFHLLDSDSPKKTVKDAEKILKMDMEGSKWKDILSYQVPLRRLVSQKDFSFVLDWRLGNKTELAYKYGTPFLFDFESAHTVACSRKFGKSPLSTRRTKNRVFNEDPSLFLDIY